LKLCPKCQVFKEITDFPFRKGSKDGVRNRCKLCTEFYQKKHKLENKEYYDKYWREYFKNRLKKDPQFKLQHFIRKTIFRSTLSKKQWSATLSLGCSIPFLKQYLESKFELGMTWENHGKWHIDHITPISKFDLTNKIEFDKACHYTNLQPLWAIDNIRKSDSNVASRLTP
jgi:hypothetical protein